MTEYITSLEEAKKIFDEALQKSDTPIEWFKNIINETYQKGYEDAMRKRRVKNENTNDR